MGIIIVMVIMIGIYYGYCKSNIINDITNNVISTTADIIPMPDITVPEEDFSKYRVNELTKESINLSSLKNMTSPNYSVSSPIPLLSSMRQISKGEITNEECLDIEQNLDKYKDNIIYDSQDQWTR